MSDEPVRNWYPFLTFETGTQEQGLIILGKIFRTTINPVKYPNQDTFHGPRKWIDIYVTDDDVSVLYQKRLTEVPHGSLHRFCIDVRKAKSSISLIGRMYLYQRTVDILKDHDIGCYRPTKANAKTDCFMVPTDLTLIEDVEFLAEENELELIANMWKDTMPNPIKDAVFYAMKKVSMEILTEVFYGYQLSNASHPVYTVQDWLSYEQAYPADLDLVCATSSKSGRTGLYIDKPGSPKIWEVSIEVDGVNREDDDALVRHLFRQCSYRHVPLSLSWR